MAGATTMTRATGPPATNGARRTPGERAGARNADDERARALHARITAALKELRCFARLVAADRATDEVDAETARSLHHECVVAERMVVAAKLAFAQRIATSDLVDARGARDAATLLADIEGVSVGEARRSLATARALDDLPATSNALFEGRLSLDKAAEIAKAASVLPGGEEPFLHDAETDTLRELRTRTRRARATSRHKDPLEAERRNHASRHFRHWFDESGAFRYEGSDTADRGAKIAALLGAHADRHYESARSEGREEPQGAYLADALATLVERGGNGDGAGEGEESAVQTSVVLYCDMSAFQRGHVEPGEICEIDGPIPVPVPVATARDLAGDSFLRLVFHEAGDIRAVHHHGRTIPARLRTALMARDRCCVVPGCTSTWNLEIDHIEPFALGGATTLDNLARLCRHHHRKKTYDGWELWNDGTSWHFEPPAAFEDGPSRRPTGFPHVPMDRAGP